MLKIRLKDFDKQMDETVYRKYKKNWTDKAYELLKCAGFIAILILGLLFAHKIRIIYYLIISLRKCISNCYNNSRVSNKVSTQ